MSDRLTTSAEIIGVASVDYLPDYPIDCRIQLTPILEEGERLDVIALQIRGLLREQNQRITRCGIWYDGLKGGVAP